MATAVIAWASRGYEDAICHLPVDHGIGIDLRAHHRANVLDLAHGIRGNRHAVEQGATRFLFPAEPGKHRELPGPRLLQRRQRRADNPVATYINS